MFGKIFRTVVSAVMLVSVLFAVEPRPLADVPIPTVDGKKITLRQYRGKVVLMVIISSTCHDCIASLDILNKVQKDLGPRGFQTIAALGDDNAQYVVGPFIQRYRPAFPVGYLNQAEMIRLADIPKEKTPVAPIFMFIDKTGVVRFQYYGDHPFFKTADGSTRSIVQGLLNQQASKRL